MPRRVVERRPTGPLTPPAKHQSHGHQQQASRRASRFLSHRQRRKPTPTPTPLSLTCLPLWRTISRSWLRKLLCSSNTHNRQVLTKASNSKGSNNRPSRCLNRPQMTWLLGSSSSSSSSHSWHRTHKAPTPSRCNNSNNCSSNQCSHSLQVLDLAATRLNRSVPRTGLRRYPRMACPTSRSNSRCSCPLLLSRYSSSQ